MEDVAMLALIAWLDASDRNAQQSDEEWTSGFQEVMTLQAILSKHFSMSEIDGFIIHKDELREIIKKQAIE